MVDEAYGDFIPDSESDAHLTGEMRSLCVVRSFSKAYGRIDIRSGYVFMSPQLAKIYRELDVPFEPALSSIHASLDMLADQSLLADIRSQALEAKEHLIGGLRAFGIQLLPTHPAVSILMAYAAKGNLYDYLSKFGIEVVPGSAFSNTLPDLNDRYVRIKVPTSLDVVRDILSKMEVNPPCV